LVFFPNITPNLEITRLEGIRQKGKKKKERHDNEQNSGTEQEF
jgi:hypothetical protein